MNTVKMDQLNDHRKPSCSDSGTESTCTADENDSMGSTGDSSSRRKRGGVKKREAGLKKEETAVPLQRPEKKSRGRVKIAIEFIEDKLTRRRTFSKRKNGVMSKVKELAKLTGTEVLLLVASETGKVYEFASDKLQPVVTGEVGKALIQSCLNSPLDSQPPSNEDVPVDVRACPQEGHDDDVPMDVSATDLEEKTDLTFQVSDSESLGNTNDDLKVPLNVASLPGTTASNSSSSGQPMVPTTPSSQESSELQVQQCSQAPMPTEGHMMYASPPHTVMYNIPQWLAGLPVTHDTKN